MRAGTASSAVRRRRFIDRPLAELVWIDLTDGVGTVEVEQEEDDGGRATTSSAITSSSSERTTSTTRARRRCATRLPAKLQSDVLQEQIADFRAVSKTALLAVPPWTAGGRDHDLGQHQSLLRFLGYLHYEQASELETHHWT